VGLAELAALELAEEEAEELMRALEGLEEILYIKYKNTMRHLEVLAVVAKAVVAPLEQHHI
jgi:hypothetical protein